MKKFMALLLAGVMICSCAAFMCGCGSDKDDNENTDPTEASTQENTEETTEAPSVTPLDLSVLDELYPKEVKHDTEHQVGYQLEAPKSGDTIAIIHTSMGDITMRFFPENAPLAVESFLSLAQEGKYDGMIFHRVIDNFMVQTGDYENADGTGGASASGTAFADEFCDTLFNIRGAVSMANSGWDTNGSQFFINQTPPEATPSWEQFQSNWEYLYEGLSTYAESAMESFIAYYGSNLLNPALVSDEVKALYTENGGNPNLDGAFNVVDKGHTVFAQVIDGMDVVDAIAAVEVDEENNKPVTDVTVSTIEVTTYQG